MVEFDLWADVCVPFLGRNNRSFAASGANINLLHQFNRCIAFFSENVSFRLYSWPFPQHFLSIKNCFSSFYFYFLLFLFLYFQQVAAGLLDFRYYFWRLYTELKSTLQQTREPPIISSEKFIITSFFSLWTKFNDTFKFVSLRTRPTIGRWLPLVLYVFCFS